MYVKLISYTNNEYGFDIIIAVVFGIIHQLGGLGLKSQDLLIYFHLSEEITLPQFHLRDLYIRGEILLLQDKTEQINNLTDKYIMELSKLKHLQGYMTPYELDYRNFECLPQSHQLSTILISKIEERQK